MAVVCLMLMQDAAFAMPDRKADALSPLSSFTPPRIERDKDGSAKVIFGKSDRFKDQTVFAYLSILIGQYLNLGISEHTIKPDIEEVIKAIGDHVGEEGMITARKNDLLLRGFRIDRSYYDPKENAYYLPIERENLPPFSYKFYLHPKEGEEPDVTIPLEDGTPVYVSLTGSGTEEVKHARKLDADRGVREMVAMAIAEAGGGAPAETFEVIWDGPDAQLAGNRSEIFRAILNLVKNSRDAVTDPKTGLPVDGAKVTVTIESRPTFVRISVSDTGPGFTPDAIDAFNRDGAVPATTKGDGHGLGVGIARDMVIRNHGYMTIVHNELAGAKVVMHLPVRGMEPYSPAFEAIMQQSPHACEDTLERAENHNPRHIPEHSVNFLVHMILVYYGDDPRQDIARLSLRIERLEQSIGAEKTALLLGALQKTAATLYGSAGGKADIAEIRDIAALDEVRARQIVGNMLARRDAHVRAASELRLAVLRMLADRDDDAQRIARDLAAYYRNRVTEFFDDLESRAKRLGITTSLASRTRIYSMQREGGEGMLDVVDADEPLSVPLDAAHVQGGSRIIVNEAEYGIAELREGEELVTDGLFECAAFIARAKFTDGTYRYFLAHILVDLDPRITGVTIARQLAHIGHALLAEPIAELEVYFDGMAFTRQEILDGTAAIRSSLGAAGAAVTCHVEESVWTERDEIRRGTVTVSLDGITFEHEYRDRDHTRATITRGWGEGALPRLSAPTSPAGGHVIPPLPAAAAASREEARTFIVDPHASDYEQWLVFWKYLKALAYANGINTPTMDSVETYATELYTNVYKRAGGGTIDVSAVTDQAGVAAIRLVARDRGTPIVDRTDPDTSKWRDPAILSQRARRTLPSRGKGFYYFSSGRAAVVVESAGEVWVKDGWGGFDKTDIRSDVVDGNRVTVTFYHDAQGDLVDAYGQACLQTGRRPHPGMTGFAYKIFERLGFSPEATARFSFAVEEPIFAVVFLNCLPWLLAVIGFPDMAPYATIFLYAATNILFGFSHDTLYAWQDGKVQPVRPATFRDKLGFMAMGAFFRGAYLIPFAGSWLGPVFAFAMHSLWNNYIAEWEGLPLGMAKKDKKKHQPQAPKQRAYHNLFTCAAYILSLPAHDPRLKKAVSDFLKFIEQNRAKLDGMLSKSEIAALRQGFEKQGFFGISETSVRKLAKTVADLERAAGLNSASAGGQADKGAAGEVTFHSPVAKAEEGLIRFIFDDAGIDPMRTGIQMVQSPDDDWWKKTMPHWFPDASITVLSPAEAAKKMRKGGGCIFSADSITELHDLTPIVKGMYDALVDGGKAVFIQAVKPHPAAFAGLAARKGYIHVEEIDCWCRTRDAAARLMALYEKVPSRSMEFAGNRPYEEYIDYRRAVEVDMSEEFKDLLVSSLEEQGFVVEKSGKMRSYVTGRRDAARHGGVKDVSGHVHAIPGHVKGAMLDVGALNFTAGEIPDGYFSEDVQVIAVVARRGGVERAPVQAPPYNVNAKRDKEAEFYIDEGLKEKLSPGSLAAVKDAVAGNANTLAQAGVRLRRDQETVRAVIVDLPEPIVINGKAILSLKIKGVCFDRDEELREFIIPTVGGVITFDKNGGYIQDAVVRHPRGGMFFGKAYHQWEMMRRAFARGVPGNYPAGFGEYKNKSFHGKKLGFVIEGLEDPQDERFIEVFSELVGTTRKTSDEIIVYADPDRIRMHKDEIIAYAAACGHALRRFHDAGLYHRFVHANNAQASGSNVAWCDLDQSLDGEELTLPQRMGYRLYDIRALLSAFPSLPNDPSNQRGVAAILQAMGISFAETMMDAYFEGAPEWRSISLTDMAINAALGRLENNDLASANSIIRLMEKLEKKEGVPVADPDADVIDQVKALFISRTGEQFPAALELLDVMERLHVRVLNRHVTSEDAARNAGPSAEILARPVVSSLDYDENGSEPPVLRGATVFCGVPIDNDAYVPLVRELTELDLCATIMAPDAGRRIFSERDVQRLANLSYTDTLVAAIMLRSARRYGLDQSELFDTIFDLVLNSFRMSRHEDDVRAALADTLLESALDDYLKEVRATFVRHPSVLSYLENITAADRPDPASVSVDGDEFMAAAKEMVDATQVLIAGLSHFTVQPRAVPRSEAVPTAPAVIPTPADVKAAGVPDSVMRRHAGYKSYALGMRVNRILNDLLKAEEMPVRVGVAMLYAVYYIEEAAGEKSLDHVLEYFQVNVPRELWSELLRTPGFEERSRIVLRKLTDIDDQNIARAMERITALWQDFGYGRAIQNKKAERLLREYAYYLGNAGKGLDRVRKDLVSRYRGAVQEPLRQKITTKVMGITPTYACGNGCRHCQLVNAPGAGKKTPAERRAIYDKAIAFAAAREEQVLVISGGEPVGRALDDVLYILEHARPYHDAGSASVQKQISITTNAAFAVDMKTTAEVLGRLYDAYLAGGGKPGRFSVQVSLDSFHQETILDADGLPRERVPLANVVNVMQAIEERFPGMTLTIIGHYEWYSDHLWQDVVNDLSDRGYHVGRPQEGGERETVRLMGPDGRYRDHTVDSQFPFVIRKQAAGDTAGIAPGERLFQYMGDFVNQVGWAQHLHDFEFARFEDDQMKRVMDSPAVQRGMHSIGVNGRGDVILDGAIFENVWSIGSVDEGIGDVISAAETDPLLIAFRNSQQAIVAWTLEALPELKDRVMSSANLTGAMHKIMKSPAVRLYLTKRALISFVKTGYIEKDVLRVLGVSDKKEDAIAEAQANYGAECAAIARVAGENAPAPLLRAGVLRVLPEEDQKCIDMSVRFIEHLMMMATMPAQELERLRTTPGVFTFEGIPGEKVLALFDGMRADGIDLTIFDGLWYEKPVVFLAAEHPLFAETKVFTPSYGFRVYLEAAQRIKSVSPKVTRSIDAVIDTAKGVLSGRFDYNGALRDLSAKLDAASQSVVVHSDVAILHLEEYLALSAEGKDDPDAALRATEFLMEYAAAFFVNPMAQKAFLFNRSLVEGFLEPEYVRSHNVGVVYLLSGAHHLYAQAVKIAEAEGLEGTRIHPLYFNRRIAESDPALLREYVEQSGLAKYDTLVIVDTGYHGTMAQKLYDVLETLPRHPARIYGRLLTLSTTPEEGGPYAYGRMQVAGWNNVLAPIDTDYDEPSAPSLHVFTTQALDTGFPGEFRSPARLVRLDDGRIVPDLKAAELPTLRDVSCAAVEAWTAESIGGPQISYPRLQSELWDWWLPDGAVENLRREKRIEGTPPGPTVLSADVLRERLAEIGQDRSLFSSDKEQAAYNRFVAQRLDAEGMLQLAAAGEVTVGAVEQHLMRFDLQFNPKVNRAVCDAMNKTTAEPAREWPSQPENEPAGEPEEPREPIGEATTDDDIVEYRSETKIAETSYARGRGMHYMEPSVPIGFTQALDYLEKHPNDKFMVDYMFRMGPQKDSEMVNETIRRFKEAPSPVLLAILMATGSKKFREPMHVIHDFARAHGVEAVEELMRGMPLLRQRSDTDPDRHILNSAFVRAFVANREHDAPLADAAKEILALLSTAQRNAIKKEMERKYVRLEDVPEVVPEGAQSAMSTGTGMRTRKPSETESDIAKIIEPILQDVNPIDIPGTTALTAVRWKVDGEVRSGRNRYRVRSTEGSSGKGLYMTSAMSSGLMETAERFSAYTGATDNWPAEYEDDLNMTFGRASELAAKGMNVIDLDALAHPAWYADQPLYWVRGETATADGVKEIYVPAQMVFTRCNLDEIEIVRDNSTGLAAGNTINEAKLHALLEVFERDADYTMFHTDDRVFRLTVENPRIKAFLDLFDEAGLEVFFLDMTTEFGVPSYRAFVKIGDTILSGSGSHLDGGIAALRAAHELLPKVMMYPEAKMSPGKRERKADGSPAKKYEELPDLSSGNIEADLDRLERLLNANGYAPSYVKMTRSDWKIPVVRAIVPGFLSDDEYSARGMAHLMKAEKVLPGSPAACLMTIFRDETLRTKPDLSVKEIMAKRLKDDGETLFSLRTVYKEVEMLKRLGILVEGTRPHTYRLCPELRNLSPPRPGVLPRVVQRILRTPHDGILYLNRYSIPRQIIPLLREKVRAALDTRWPAVQSAPTAANAYENERFINRSFDMRNASFHQDISAEIDRRLQASPDKPVTVLMIGIGRGFEAFGLMRRYGSRIELTAVDKTDMVYRTPEELARRFLDEDDTIGSQWAADLIRKLRSRFFRADLDEGIPLPGPYDIVIMGCGVSSYVARKIPALEECVRLTAEGGVFYGDLDLAFVETGHGPRMTFGEYMRSLGLAGVSVYGEEKIRIARRPGLTLPAFELVNAREYDEFGLLKQMAFYRPLPAAPESTAQDFILPVDPDKGYDVNDPDTFVKIRIERKSLTKDGRRFQFTAFEGGMFAGQVVCADEASVGVSVADLAVLARYQEAGVGVLLMRMVFDEAHRMGRGTVFLRCFENNGKALRFYDGLPSRIGGISVSREDAGFGMQAFTYTLVKGAPVSEKTVRPSPSVRQVARQLTEDEISLFEERIDASLPERFATNVRYVALQQSGGTCTVAIKKMKVDDGEPWRTGAAYMVRVGHLFFVDDLTYEGFSSELKRDLAPNAIRVGQLQAIGKITESDTDGPLADIYAWIMIAEMMRLDLAGAEVIDVGAGNGILALAAYKLGAEYLQLVDYDPKRLTAAKKLLESNGLENGRDFIRIEGDIKQTAALAARLRPSGRETVVLSNIGNWPGVYPVTNADSMRLLAHLSKVRAFIAGGYMEDASKGRVHIPTDRSIINSYGLTPSPSQTSYTDHEGVHAAWSAGVSGGRPAAHGSPRMTGLSVDYKERERIHAIQLTDVVKLAAKHAPKGTHTILALGEGCIPEAMRGGVLNQDRKELFNAIDHLCRENGIVFVHDDEAHLLESIGDAKKRFGADAKVVVAASIHADAFGALYAASKKGEGDEGKAIDFLAAVTVIGRDFVCIPSVLASVMRLAQGQSLYPDADLEEKTMSATEQYPGLRILIPKAVQFPADAKEQIIHALLTAQSNA